MAGEMGETETARTGEQFRFVLGLGDKVRPHLPPESIPRSVVEPSGALETALVMEN
jgi:hypothetical protein